MRLKVLDQVMQDQPVPDMGRVDCYRPKLHGAIFDAIFQELMRGVSDWSVGERELLAAFVSSKNHCSFCGTFHSAIASKAIPEHVTRAVLQDWRTAPLDEKLRVTLGFLEKLTLTPGEITLEDVTSLRAVGVSDQAIEDSIYICAWFQVLNRLADAFGCALPPAEVLTQMAGFLLEHGYLLPQAEEPSS